MAITVFDLMAHLGLDSSEFDAGLNKAKSAGAALGNGLASAAKIGMAAITAATGAVVGMGAAAVKTGMNFDQSMSQVAATMGKTMADMENETGSVMLTLNGQTQEFTGTLREFAQEMGRNTAFSATQAADALNYMALAGYKTQESMEMLPNVLNLAAAGSMDLARASDMVTDTQTAFGISFERTTQMVDEMAKAASTGNTSVAQLGDAFLVIGGLAQELNGGMVDLADGTTAEVDGLQELEIALTAMANAGVKGSEAGTHMRNMLLKLASPTSAGTKQLEALGVSVFDTEGNMRSLANIFGDLSGELDNLTQEEKLQAISDLFNTRDLAAAEALLNAVGQDWDKIGESILDAEGAAQQMADTQLNNLAGDVTLFKSALEGAQIAVSDELTPALRQFVQLGTTGLSDITSAFKEGGLEGAMTAFGETLSQGLTMVTAMLPDAINAGMALLGAIGQGIMDNLDEIIDAGTEIIVTLITAFASNLDGMIEAGKTLINGIVTALSENSEELMTAGQTIIETLFNALVENLPEMMTFVTEMITSFMGWIGEHSSDIATMAVGIITALVEGLVTNLPTLITGAVELITSLATAFTDPSVMTPLISGGLQLIMALAQGLLNALPQLIAVGPVVMENLINGIVENIDLLVEGAVQLIGMLVEALLQNMPLVISAGIQITFALLKGILQMVPPLIAGIISLMGEIVSSIIVSLPEIVAGGVQIVDSLIEGIVSMFGTMIQNAIELVAAFISGITRSAAKIIQAGKDMIEKVKEGIMSKIEEAKQWGSDLISNFVSGITEGWDKLKGAIGGAAQVIADNIGFSEPKEGVLSNFHTYAPDMMKLFSEGIKDNAYLVRDAFAESVDLGAVSATVSATNNNSEIISLLQQIRDGGTVQVVLEGDTDRLFRAMQRKATSNYRLTGNPGMVLI